TPSVHGCIQFILSCQGEFNVVLPDERLINRSLTFLRCISRRRRIRVLLQTRGYSGQVHREGWTLWKAVVGVDWVAEKTDADLDQAMSAIMSELDAWDEPNLGVASAALRSTYPDQHRFLFNDLSPGQKEDSLIAIETFLGRLDQMDSGDNRPEAQREGDREALERLASRGITSEERARVRGMLDQLAELDDIDTTHSEAPASKDEELQRNLKALEGWFGEWSGIARAIIQRRDYLIALGLAKPRRREAEVEPEA
ncbi:MAG: hypothetical protein AAFS10_05420, partial [Myxococcota bacterium]